MTESDLTNGSEYSKTILHSRYLQPMDFLAERVMLIAHTTDVPQSQQQIACSKFEQAIQDAGVFSQNFYCRMHEGCLSIHGIVQNYRQKQLAQEAVRQLPGVLEISNQLQISPP